MHWLPNLGCKLINYHIHVMGVIKKEKKRWIPQNINIIENLTIFKIWGIFFLSGRWSALSQYFGSPELKAQVTFSDYLSSVVCVFFLLQYFHYKIIIEAIPPQRPSEVCHHMGCQGLPGSDWNIEYDYLTFWAY